MKTLLYATLALVLTATAALPVVSAGHDDPPEPTCVDQVCVSVCFSLGFCADPTDPNGTAKDFVHWLKERFGPCTCDPQPQPW